MAAKAETRKLFVTFAAQFFDENYENIPDNTSDPHQHTKLCAGS